MLLPSRNVHSNELNFEKVILIYNAIDDAIDSAINNAIDNASDTIDNTIELI